MTDLDSLAESNRLKALLIQDWEHRKKSKKLAQKKSKEKRKPKKR